MIRYMLALIVYLSIYIGHGLMKDSEQYFFCIHKYISFASMTMMPIWKRIDSAIQSIPTKRPPRKEPSPWRWKKRPSVRYAIAFTALAYSATAKPTERVSLFDTDSEVVGVDNRCTACMSHISEDFVPGTLKPATRVTVKGFGGARIENNIQIGTLLWKFNDDQGVKHSFRIPNSYFVPEGGMRLLSPQHWAKVQKDRDRLGTGAWTGPSEVVLYWKGRTHRRTLSLDVRSNVADLHLAPGYLSYDRFCQSQCVDPETLPADTPFVANPTIIPPEDEDETTKAIHQDLSDDWQPEQTTPRTFSLAGPSTQEERDQAPAVIIDEEDQQEATLPLAAELLRYHQRFGHISFTKLQAMAKKGIIPKRLAKCKKPFCSACAYAKATKRPWRNRGRVPPVKLVPITRPGQVVSVDQLKSPTPGLIAQMAGFLLRKERYNYATVFVDHYSNLSFVYLQKTASAAETLEAKKAFERYAATRGITIRAYHADNGIFKAQEWVKECIRSNQPLTFAGVGAHHQNGKAEKRIRDLQDMTRTILIHANRRWPNAITPELWPYALRQANICINAAPSLQDKQRRSPNQLFENHNVEINVKHWHRFGCPIYVLAEPLRDNKPFHKWKYRSRVGVYLGQSPIHNQSVALVLSLETGHVSPQFHTKFDGSFHSNKQINLPSKWQQKTGFIWSPPETRKRKLRLPSTSSQRTTKRVHFAPEPNDSEGATTQTQTRTSTSSSSQEQHVQTTQNGSTDAQVATHPNKEEHPQVGPLAPSEPTHNSGPISGRTRSQNEKQSPGRMMTVHECLLEVMRTELSNSVDVPGELFCFSALFPYDEPSVTSERNLAAQRAQHIDEQWCMNTTADLVSEYESQCKREPLFKNIMACKATSDPDTMYRHEAMKEPDYNQFLKAMEKEVRDQMGNNNFHLVKRTSLPNTATLLPAVWQMKRKRDIRTRAIKKYKARLNVDGSRMKQGIHYDLTYSPVAAWSSIRLILALAATHGWHTKQIDYVLAFPQAPVERPLYMEIPKGIEFEGKPASDWVFQLEKNVYGQKQAGRVWNRYLAAKLINEVGFTQSTVDECIFFKGRVLYVLYTDDSILVGPSEEEIQSVIQQIKATGLQVTEEGDLEDFLGVNIHRNKQDGTIKFSQPHLIDKILAALRMDQSDLKTKSTPENVVKKQSRFSKKERPGTNTATKTLANSPSAPTDAKTSFPRAKARSNTSRS